jgi:hypothetical protein
LSGLIFSNRRTTHALPRDATGRIHLSGVGEFLHGIKQQE